MTEPRPAAELQIRVLDPRLHDQLPAYASVGAAGLDLRACLDAALVLEPGATALISTGVAIHLADPGLAGIILPRSGLGHRHGVVLGNLVGLVDSDYQGPLMVSLWNRSAQAYRIEVMERVAQLVVITVLQVRLRAVTSFAASVRGADGFGSTGAR